MAHRGAGGARPARYQGGASFNVFSAQGSNPTSDCKVCGKGVQKLYDKSVKTYVYSLCGGPTSKIQLPKDEIKTDLQLLQPFVVFQIFVPASQPFALELRVTDTTNTRRKMYFSTSFSDIKATPLHYQIPIRMVIRGTWLSLSIHVADLFAHCFKGMIFRSVDAIVLGPVCKLRKIFTMRNRLSNFGGVCNSFNAGGEDYLPQEHMFALGVENAFQVLDMATLQVTIAGLCDPSNGTRGNNLKLRKVKMNKLESRQVHVAFGSRMPLPLSTVQINTNLPGDNKFQSHRAFCKERIERVGQTSHIQSEIPSILSNQIQTENKVESKAETLQNLLKHANTFNKNHAMIKLKKDQTLLDHVRIPTIDEPIERSYNVHFCTQELQPPPDLTTTDACKFEAGIDGIMALAFVNKGDDVNMLSKGDSTITHLQWSKAEVHSTLVPQLESLNVQASNVNPTEANNLDLEEPPTYIRKKIEEYKLPDPEVGLGKYVRRGSHGESDRRKEYKQTRYMDSPPESPPCGWTSCHEDDAGEKPLKIPSFFNKFYDKINGIDKSKDSVDIRESSSFDDSHLMGSLHDLDEEDDTKEEMKFLANESSKFEYSPDNLHAERSMIDIVKSTFERIENFVEDRPRPIGVVHEKFDLGNGDNSLFHDDEFATTMSDEDCSFGRQSWSSDDFQHGQGGKQFLVINTNSTKKSKDTSQELSTTKYEDKGDDLNSPNYFSPLQKQYIHNCDSFEFCGTLYDNQIENLQSSPTIAQPQSKTSNKDIKISSCDIQNSLQEGFISSSDSMESTSKHSVSSFVLRNEHENINQADIIKHDDTNITVNNGRPDEDLDLLYDPTLDCYYDPKTNRYYELK